MSEEWLARWEIRAHFDKLHWRSRAGGFFEVWEGERKVLGPAVLEKAKKTSAKLWKAGKPNRIVKLPRGKDE